MPLVGAIAAVGVLVASVWPPVTPPPLVVVGWLTLAGGFSLVRRRRVAGVFGHE